MVVDVAPPLGVHRAHPGDVGHPDRLVRRARVEDDLPGPPRVEDPERHRMNDGEVDLVALVDDAPVGELRDRPAAPQPPDREVRGQDDPPPGRAVERPPVRNLDGECEEGDRRDDARAHEPILSEAPGRRANARATLRAVKPPAASLVRRFRRSLLAWYGTHGRDLPWRRTRAPYRVLVSEIMLQQTHVDRVVPKYLQFLRHHPPLR